MSFFDSFVFTFVILPLLIFLARIIDVSMDTIRIIAMSKGFKKFTPFIGFFQSLIWLLAITRIMANLENWVTYFAYAAGFASGTFLGMIIEERLAMGYELIRVITRREAEELIMSLREKGYPVTSVDAMGRDGEVGVIFIILKRKNLREVVNIIKNYNPNAFYTIEDIRFISSPPVIPSIS